MVVVRFYVAVCVLACVQVFHNIEGDDNWAECFNAPNIDLPTGYYFGFSAATGDLAGLFVCLCVSIRIYYQPPDNHDIISVKTYDVDSEGAENEDGKEVVYFYVQDLV